MGKQSLGEKIAFLRKEKNINQREFAEKLFVSDKTVSRWERDVSAPDILLLPRIAEIFGVTVDELLQNEFVPAPIILEKEVGMYEMKNKESDTNVWETLLQNRYIQYKNHGWIAIGLALAGIIAAILCNAVFCRAILGGCLGVAFFLSASICQICFVNSTLYYTKEEEKSEIISLHNSNVTKRAVKIFLLLFFLFLWIIPLFFVGSGRVGLAAYSWIRQIHILLLLGFLLYFFVYKLCIEKRLEGKGFLYFEEKELVKNTKQKRVMLRAGIPCVSIAIIALVAFLVIADMSAYTFIKPRSFSSYEEFQAYMAIEKEGNTWFDETIVLPLPDTEKEETEEPQEIFYLLNNNGEELCSYVWNNKDVSSIVCSQEKDGLPIEVYEYDDWWKGQDIQQDILYFVRLLFYANELVFAVLYILCTKNKENR